MKKLIMLLAVPFLVSCWACPILQTASVEMGDFLAGPNELSCNPSCMEKAVATVLAPTSLCSSTKDCYDTCKGKKKCAQGVIASIACPIIDGAVMELLTVKLQPTLAQCNCTKTPPQTNLNAWLLAACDSLPF